MVFSSPVFVFLFLPLTLGLYYLSPKLFRNTVLLLASLIFYAWGEIEFVAVMLGSIAANYSLALAIDRATSNRVKQALLLAAVGANLGALVVFKYTPLILETLAFVPPLKPLLPAHSFREIVLPLGISFFTFQALSYVIDVYRGQVPAHRNPLNIALYIALFPQLVAGPIVRYIDVAAQIHERSIGLDDLATGARRFILGLGKKMLIANTLAAPADAIFGMEPGSLQQGVAWVGLACYAFQIYFDFSGYSDMAIGLGRMMGFRFLENFAYPYAASSVTDFWRRWHISLSTFFRDYLYIPLGGNRCPAWRVYLNLGLVFFLCGLWHGANWTFVCWGLFHGLFLILERSMRAVSLPGILRVLRHAYVLLVVALAWVFFRCDTLPHAFHYLKNLAGWAGTAPMPASVDAQAALVLGVAAIGSMPLAAWWRKTRDSLEPTGSLRHAAMGLMSTAGLALILVGSAMKLASGSYNPFIYYRF